MSNARPFEAKVRGLTLRGLQWGKEGAWPLLAVHGWMDNAASFETLAPTLARDFHVVAIDLPGHGRSDHRPANAEYHYVDWVLDVSCLLDSLGWQRCVGVGHSMGAGILALAAGADPSRFESLVLLEGLGPFTTEAPDAPENLRMALKGRRLNPSPQNRVYEALEEMTARRLAMSSDLNPETLSAIIERGTQAVESGFVFTHDPRLKARSVLRFTEPHVCEFLGRIECPVLLIRANNGLVYDEDAIQKRLARIAKLEVLRVEGAHHVHVAHPERLLAPICSFAAQSMTA